MAFFLFFQTFFQGVHQLVPAHFFDGGFLLRGEFVFQDFFQPFHGHIGGEIGQHFNAFEIRAKGFVELVEMLFVLDQSGAAEVIKIVHAACIALWPHHIGLHGFEQHQKFFHRYRQFGRAQCVEEVDQHVWL